MIMAVAGHVLIGLRIIRVIIIGQHLRNQNALMHHLEESRTIAVQHVAIVTVYNVLNNRKAATYYDRR